MPRKNKEEFESTKRDLKELYDKKFANLNVSEKKDPVLFQIKTLLSNDEGREKQDDIAKLCFDYLFDNKSDAYSKTKRGIFDSILDALSIVDNGLAKYVEDAVNNDKVMASRTNAKERGGIKPVNALVVYDETKTRESGASEKSETGDDPRIENLKELLKRLKSKEVDPWYHKNSEQFDNMVKSIEHAVEYSKAMEKGYGSKEVLDKMLVDVRNNTLDYLEKKSDTPDSKYGQSRINLAIASLLSVDRKKGLEAIDMVATKRLIRLEKDRDNFLAQMGEDPTKTRFSKSTFMSLDKIIKETGYKDSITREDMSLALNDRLDDIRKNIIDPENGTSELDLAKYVIFKTMSDMLPGMTGIEWKKFDVSNEELDKQSSNIMSSDPFIKAHIKVLYDDPNKNIQPEEFFVTFKVTYMDDHNTRMNNNEPRRNANIPGAKSTKELYDEIKEYFQLDKDAKYDEVKKAVKQGIKQHHPDKHLSESAEERSKHDEIFKKIDTFNKAINDKQKEFRELDNVPKVSVPKNDAPVSEGPARRL